MLGMLERLQRLNVVPPPRYSAYDHFVMVRHRTEPKQYYLQQVTAHKSNLLALGYLVLTNLGTMSDRSGFLQVAMMNPELTGSQLPQITSKTKWCELQPGTDTNSVTMIILRDEVASWADYTEKWVRQHRTSNSPLQGTGASRSASPTNLAPATAGSRP